MPIQTLGAIQNTYVSWEPYTLGAPNSNLILVWPTTYAESPNIAGTTTNLVVNAVGCSVNLPNANEVSLGMNIIVRSDPISTQSVQINNADGQAIQTIAAGTTYYIQLTAYSALPQVGGTWISTPLGGNATQVDAAALAGAGLQAEAAKLNTVTFIKEIVADYTVLDTDQSTMLVANSVGTIDLTLPVFPAGFQFSVNNSGGGTVDFILPAGVTINNQDTFSLSSTQTLTLISDGNNYWSLGLGQNNGFADTIISVDLSDFFPPNVGGNIVLPPNILQQFVLQFYIGDGTPVTANYTLYFGNTASDWYLSNFCTTTNGSTISIQLGTPITPLGPPIVLPMQQKLITYSAADPNTGQLQMYSVPTTLAASGLLLANGTAGAPPLSFLSDQTSGIYLPATYSPAIAGHGVQIATFSATNALRPQILVNTGASTNPAYSFSGSTNFGVGTGGLTLDLFASNAAPTASFITTGGGVSSTFALVAPASSATSRVVTSAANTTVSFTNGANVGDLTLTGTATASTLSLISAPAAPAINLVANAATGIISYNAINAISISNAGHVTFPAAPIPLASGGTGQITAPNAINALMPVSTAGALAYFDGANWLTLPAVSATATYPSTLTLPAAGGVPFWS